MAVGVARIIAHNNLPMQRREFLLTGCKACTALLAAPALLSLEGCASARGVSFTEEGSVVKLPGSAFAQRNAVVVRPSSLMNDLLVVKEPSGGYKAFLMKCPHKGQPLGLQGNVAHCEAHGSEFDLEGNVVKGPARTGLKSYPVSADGDQVRVDLR